MRPLLFFIVIVLTACSGSVTGDSQFSENREEQVESSDTTRFRPYKQDLFINATGQVAYKTIDNSDPTNPEDKFVTLINTDTLDLEQKKELIEVIDTATFIHIGDYYYKDKNRIYYHFPMADGGPFFIVWEADPKSFQVVDSSYYGKDNQHVFHRGTLLEQADTKSFKVVSQHKGVYSWTAKDKNHNYDGADVVRKELNN